MSGREIPTTDTPVQAPNPWAAAASRALHPSSCRPAAPSGSATPEDDWLWAIASGLAEVTIPWQLRVGANPSPGERHWELALATPDYEVWTIYWPPGTGIDLHDHGPSSGAFCVVSGELLETVVDADGRLEERVWSRGEGTQFGSSHTHRVINGGRSTATSVHVYSPPLSAMTYYDGATEVGRSTLRERFGDRRDQPGAIVEPLEPVQHLLEGGHA